MLAATSHETALWCLWTIEIGGDGPNGEVGHRQEEAQPTLRQLPSNGLGLICKGCSYFYHPASFDAANMVEVVQTPVALVAAVGMRST
jgi:hypothetical protein